MYNNKRFHLNPGNLLQILNLFATTVSNFSYLDFKWCTTKIIIPVAADEGIEKLRRLSFCK